MLANVNLNVHRSQGLGPSVVHRVSPSVHIRLRQCIGFAESGYAVNNR